jgi:phage shock protein A
MGLFDRLSRVVRANLNDMVGQAEDPEKILEQAVIDMQEDLVQLRQAVARSIAEQKKTEQRYNQDFTEAGKWEQRAKLALSKGDETLAREALTRKKSLTDSANVLKQQLEQQTAQVDTLRRNLMALESKISEAKTKKNMLQARAKAAKANEQLQKTLGNIDTSSATSVFERMETKVMEMEASSQAVGELAGFGVEQQFAELEANSDVEDELAMLKAGMQESLPPAETPKQLPEAASSSKTTDPVVDAELEDLQTKLKDI